MLWLIFLVSGAINLLGFVVPLNMLQVYDRVLPTGSRETLLAVALIVVVALGFYGLFDALRQRILVRTGVWMERFLGPRIIRATLNRGDVSPAPGAEMRDLALLRGFVASPTFAALFDLPWIPLYLLVLGLMHPLFGLLAVGVVALIATLMRLNFALSAEGVRRTKAAQRQAAEIADPLFRQTDVVQALGMGGALEARWREVTAASREAQLLASDRAGLAGGMAKAIRLLGQAAVLWMGAELFLEGATTGGAMIAASIFVARAIQPVDAIISNWTGVIGALDAWRRTRSFLANHAPPPETMPLPEPMGELKLDRVCIEAQGRSRPILNGITLSIAPGEVLGVVGPSGSGKSTLCLALCGAKVPSAGTIRLDGATFDQWDRDALGSHVGYLAQDAELFAGTIRENIARFGANEAQDVVAAAKLVGAHRLILELPQGYDTHYAPGDKLLSRGQRQRLALARAVFGKMRLVVLDEPNTHLDAEGEVALMNTIKALKTAGATVIVAAHRISLLMSADRILALRDGAIEALGPRDEVLKRYARPAEPPARSLIETLSSQARIGDPRRGAS